jgi:hypothetical protein
MASAKPEAGGERRGATNPLREPNLALPARPPAPTRALERDRESRHSHLQAREPIARRSLLRGLVLAAVVAMLAGIAHAGLDRVFVHGWWRQW